MKQMFFWNSLAFSMIQQMLAIWSLVPLSFPNPACTFQSFQFMYSWSLAWRILSITLLACEIPGLMKSQAGIKISGRNINNLRYTDDTTLMAEVKRKQRASINVKDESGKAGWNSTIKKRDSTVFGSITSWQIEGDKVEVVTDFLLLCSKITVDSECNHEIKRWLLL